MVKGDGGEVGDDVFKGQQCCLATVVSFIALHFVQLPAELQMRVTVGHGWSGESTM